jgi:hypothetical protein
MRRDSLCDNGRVSNISIKSNDVCKSEENASGIFDNPTLDTLHSFPMFLLLTKQ